MHRTALLFGAICFILMAAGSYFAAVKAVDYLEDSAERQVSEALFAAGEEWASIKADGLKVHLGGLAPDEASRFSALEIIGKVIDSGRLTDNTKILQTANIDPPRFSLEVLRNEEKVSLIGLIPEAQGRDEIITAVEALDSATRVTDMLETANYPVSREWLTSLEFGLNSLTELPRSKISISPEKVIVTAVAESVVEKKEIEAYLKENKPQTIQLIMNISSPRPVISPFSFRMSLNEEQAELTACSADTNDTREKIFSAVRRLDVGDDLRCKIGLGVPTPDWAKAIVQCVEALDELGGGVLTFTDSDISLVATDTTEQSDFDRIVGRLENSLPELFSLHAVLPPKILETGEAGGIVEPEFLATKSPEGLVQLRGRVTNEQIKKAIDTYATSLFGNELVFFQTRVDENLPNGWPVRVLGGLEALSKLHHGILVVTPGTVEVKGVGARPEVPSEVSRILSVRVGGKGNYKIDVDFDEALFVIDEAPSDIECEQAISALLNRDQINFEPGSTRIDAESLVVVADIADILRKCPDAKFEIEGHTDSQGGADLNLSISQQRAEAVLSALLSQRVLTSGIVAKGYGPERPIADNGTEEGRALNRRIAFRLISEDTETDNTEALTDEEPEETTNE